MSQSRRHPFRSQFDRVRNRLRSILSAGDGTDTGDERTAIHDTGGDPAAASDDEKEGAVDAPGNLFHCPTCAIVYIDAEKNVCSQCDGDVRQVRSTLSCR